MKFLKGDLGYPQVQSVGRTNLYGLQGCLTLGGQSCAGFTSSTGFAPNMHILAVPRPVEPLLQLTQGLFSPRCPPIGLECSSVRISSLRACGTRNLCWSPFPFSPTKCWYRIQSFRRSWSHNCSRCLVSKFFLLL